MNDRITRRNTWLFAGVLLLACITNPLSRTGIAELDSLMTVFNYLICTGLLLKKVIVNLRSGWIRTALDD